MYAGMRSCCPALHNVVYTSNDERKQFFASKGLEYLEHERIVYHGLEQENVYESELFLADPDAYKKLSYLYADHIQQGALAHISIRFIDERVGYGIFAEQDLEQGQFVGIYTGIIENKQNVSDKDYAWAYPSTHDHISLVVDARQHGNELRYVNDHQDPNCNVIYVIGYDKLWHVCYVARRAIKKGEQLFVSYGPSYWKTRDYTYQNLV
jgi:hypothetical protein